MHDIVEGTTAGARNVRQAHVVIYVPRLYDIICSKCQMSDMYQNKRIREFNQKKKRNIKYTEKKLGYTSYDIYKFIMSDVLLR